MRQCVIEVSEKKPVEKSYRDDNGRTQFSYTQSAFMHMGAEYPLPFSMRHDRESECLPPGRYAVGGPCFKIGQYGLELVRKQMDYVPLEVAIAELIELRDSLGAASARPSPTFAVV